MRPRQTTSDSWTELKPGEDDRTTVDLTVYGWLAGATGEFTPFGGAPTLAFDNSFGEVLEDLRAAFMASAHIRRGRFVVLLDTSYAALSREGLVPPGIPARGEVSQFSLTAAAGARVVDDPALTLELLAGGRLWNLDGRVEVPLAGVALAPDKTFVDPVAGARLIAQVAPGVSLLAYADAGGLGVGSNFTYQLLGTANFRLGSSLFLSAGYRHLHIDYDSGGTAFDGSQTGPLVGITKRF